MIDRLKNNNHIIAVKNDKTQSELVLTTATGYSTCPLYSFTQNEQINTEKRQTDRDRPICNRSRQKTLKLPET